jgi:ABC-type cobalt transport system substrate-binding protein
MDAPTKTATVVLIVVLVVVLAIVIAMYLKKSGRFGGGAGKFGGAADIENKLARQIDQLETALAGLAEPLQHSTQNRIAAAGARLSGLTRQICVVVEGAKIAKNQGPTRVVLNKHCGNLSRDVYNAQNESFNALLRGINQSTFTRQTANITNVLRSSRSGPAISAAINNYQSELHNAQMATVQNFRRAYAENKDGAESLIHAINLSAGIAFDNPEDITKLSKLSSELVSELDQMPVAIVRHAQDEFAKHNLAAWALLDDIKKTALMIRNTPPSIAQDDRALRIPQDNN